MIKTLLAVVFIFCLSGIYAATISGTVTDIKGHPIPYASITIKGTTIGVAANQEGNYHLQLQPGKYTIVCQFVGYESIEKNITAAETDTTLDFQMQLQATSLGEVVVHTGGQDPAYSIIKHAIKKRAEYRQPLDSFTVDMYLKVLIKTRKLPNRILGRKIPEADKKEVGIDSAGKGVIYLSESVTKVSVKKPDKIKLEMISGRQSGSDGYGFNFPTFVNFYENNIVLLTEQFTPRGFISPIAEDALHYYKYKFLGTFIDNGKEVNKIQVIPKRKFEPLFSGIINIFEGDWHIHSVDLLLTKESQLNVADTINIKQIATEVAPNVWKSKSQTCYVTFNILGVEGIGNFVNVYNNFNAHPSFPGDLFNNVVAVFDSAENKRNKGYWDSARPVQLTEEEAKDYEVKDSIFAYKEAHKRSQAYIDSMRCRQGAITLGNIFYSGFTRSNYQPDKLTTFRWEPLLPHIQYNTVEGVAAIASASISHHIKAWDRTVTLYPSVRYGFNNGHLNPWATLGISRKYKKDMGYDNVPETEWILAGGKRITQFNAESPITPLMNEIRTLFYKENYMKLYENYFASVGYHKKLSDAFSINANFLYENRLPIENSTDFSFFFKDRVFTPNYPTEQLTQQFTAYKASILTLKLQYRPGQRFIQYPNNKVSIGSTQPVFEFEYKKGIEGLFGSSVDFDRWALSMRGNKNFKLQGLLKYHFSMGGFLNSREVFIQDYQHFNGNQVFLASTYLNSFQLAPYYANSTTATFYATGNIEHHFNGMLTNKIPLFRRLNWHLVAGSNAFYVTSKNNYVEVFGGLENIFKTLRVDFITSFLNGQEAQFGVRLGFGGFIGRFIQRN